MNYFKILINYKKELIGFLLFILIFISLSLVFQKNEEFIVKIIEPNVLGMFIYILIGIFTTVFAPLSSLPFLPLAVVLWGWFPAGIMTTISWSIGSLIAFFLARKFGRKIVLKFIDEQGIKKYEDLIPEKNLFLSIILLRMILPADLLSYVLGLLTRISYKLYISATIIGILPFALLLAYLGSLSLVQQLLFFGIIGFLCIIVFLFTFKEVLNEKFSQKEEKENFISIGKNKGIKIKLK